jgi:4-amino-4-deoxy-L-arabinose transferase-like glycosyltransferase
MTGRNVLIHGRAPRASGDRWLVLLLLGLGLPIFLLGLGSPALFDPHESLYAEVAREMVMRGEWLTPHLNGTRYLDKPPLFYWLITMAYMVFGVSEPAARLPIALAGLGGVLVTWGIGRHLFDGRTGVLAGLVLTTSVGYFVFSRQLLPDMVFACFTTLSFYGFLRAVEPDRSRRAWGILSYMSLALAVMTKGFLGVFPLVVLTLHFLIVGRLHALRALISLWGGMLFFLLIVPYHLILGWQNEGYFWHYFMNEHFLRFLGRRHPVDFISLPLPIFFLMLFLWLLPWSPYLALTIPRKWPSRGKPLAREDEGYLFILLWAGMVLLFFALSRARLPQYSLPAMPALGLLIGKSLDERFTGSVSSTTGLLLATTISVLLPALALLILPSYLDQYHQLGLTDRAVSLIRLVFGLMAGGSGLALLCFARKRWVGGLLSLAVGMVAAFYCTHQVLLHLQSLRTSQGLAVMIEANRKPGERIVLEVEKDDPFEYEKIAGLAFYTGQPVDLLRRKNPPEPSLPLKPTERFLLSEAEFRQLWASAERVYLVTDSFLDGDGILEPQSTFSVVGQVGNRWVVSNRP